MYAIVLTGGKQHKASVGDVLEVEKLQNSVSDELELEVVLKVDGDNVIAGEAAKNLKARAKVVSHGKAKKIVVFKYKPKKNERKKQGHRQPYTRIRITSID